MDMIPTPKDYLETLANMKFSQESNARIHELMSRNTEGQLTPQERKELASLASSSEDMSLVRARALLLLGRKPT